MAGTRREAMAWLLKAGIAGPVLIFSHAFSRAGPKPANGPTPPAKTGFVYGDVYLRHRTSAGHPERPERLTAIVGRLKEANLLGQLMMLEPRAAALEWLRTVHSREYVERVAKQCRQDAAHIDTMDVSVSADSYDVALEAVGGVLAAVDAVMAGKVRNAFCAVRPPGHHALRDKAMGFCLFNNVAIAARYIQKKYGLKKVLIVDWDVHHGNGTQATTYADPTVLYFGIHQWPFYPGTGAADERGEGKGLGFTVNVPLPAGCGNGEYRKAFEEILAPAARTFRPDFVLISAGFAAPAADPLGGMKVTAEGFAQLTLIVKRIADAGARGRIVSVLEGGYNLDALAASVEAHLRVLMEPQGRR